MGYIERVRMKVRETLDVLSRGWIDREEEEGKISRARARAWLGMNGWMDGLDGWMPPNLFFSFSAMFPNWFEKDIRYRIAS